MLIEAAPAAEVDEILLHLDVDGWHIIDGVIPDSQVSDVRDSVVKTVESDAYLRDKNFLAVDRDFVSYVADARIAAVLEAVWGRFARVAFTGPIIRQPGDGRGGWHTDWPFGGGGAASIEAPFPDTPMYLTSIWMLSEFTAETGGTLIVPASHRSLVDPVGDDRVDPKERRPTEMRVSGKPGSVLIFDSRMWHAKPNHDGNEPRVAMRVCYAPWWLNLQPLDPESPEGTRMSEEAGTARATASPSMPRIPREAYEAMPKDVKPLYHHWVRW